MALRALSKLNIDYSPIKAEDIVGGHREKTLHLLWVIIHNYQLSKLLDLSTLRDEINKLEKSLRVSRLPHQHPNLREGKTTHKKSESNLSQVKSQRGSDNTLSLLENLYYYLENFYLSFILAGNK